MKHNAGMAIDNLCVSLSVSESLRKRLKAPLCAEKAGKSEEEAAEIGGFTTLKAYREAKRRYEYISKELTGNRRLDGTPR